MAQIFDLDRATPTDPAAVRAAVDALRAGALVVFPTETVPGIAARADDPSATARLFEAKRRASDLALPVMAGTPDEALALAEPNPDARALASAFWPGPLTIVLRRGARSRAWGLGDRADTIGLRVPDHPVPSAILAGTGPLAVSSANVSGVPPASSADELREAFGDLVAVYLVTASPLVTASAQDATSAPRERDRVAPSTVVDLTTGAPTVSRRGSIDEGSILRVLGGASLSARPATR
jgi:L-threonylcarbamoyladenylate synthase